MSFLKRALLPLVSVIMFSFMPLYTASYSAETLRDALVESCKKYIGTPYKYGGMGPNFFDCSGFIYAVARESTGYQLPRTSRALYMYVKSIPEKDMEKGDIVFFKTTSTDNVSHAGIYIGNKQFIHAASDGPVTGVIISSLNESYWHSKYAGSGAFLPPIHDKEIKPKEAGIQKANTETKPNAVTKDDINSPVFGESFVCDVSIAIDWSFFTTHKIKPNFRGINFAANICSTTWPLKPGVGVIMRFNTDSGIFQMPLVFSIALNEYIRAFAGPVLTAGKAELPDDNKEIECPVVPGIIGITGRTPVLFTVKGAKIALFQDISYTFFTNKSGNTLSLKNSLAAGLLFSTGIRVTLPASIVL